jgi:hypothetical protein
MGAGARGEFLCLGWQHSRAKCPISTVVAGKVTGGKLLWWHDGSLLQRWGRSTVELLLLCLLKLSQLELWMIAPVLLWLRLA